MKKFLSLLLALLFCLSFIVSCEKEETPSSSLNSSSESSSNIPSSKPSLVEKETVTVDRISIEHFSTSYPSCISLIDDYYDYWQFEEKGVLISWDEFYLNGPKTQVITNYDELLACQIYNDKLDFISEKDLENNFVLLINGWSEVIRIDDVYYSDIQKNDEHYTITYNLVGYKQGIYSEAMEGYVDVCVVPKDLFEGNPSDFKIEVIRKDYKFKGEKYNSSCEVTTYLSE